MNGQNNLIESTNQLIKQYISSYKYYQSLAVHELDEQFEKDFRVQVYSSMFLKQTNKHACSLQIDRIINGVVRFIESYDIDSLIALFEFFNTKLFNNLDEVL